MSIKIVKVGEASFEIGRLSAMQQFHISRRLLPLIGKIAPNLVGAVGKEGKARSNAMLKMIPVVAEALSGISDADAEYVINHCLAVVSIQQGQSWPKLTTPTGVPMFPIDLEAMLTVTAHVIVENLGSFFTTSLPAMFGGLSSPSSSPQ